MTTTRPSHSTHLLGSLALLCALVPCATAAQQIAELSHGFRPRSGRLLVFGTGFGAQQGPGQVVIDGIPAIATTWTDTEIHAYVPEQSTLGAVDVEVQTLAGASNVVPLIVTTRTSEDRIRWRFQLDSPTPGAWSVAGPDGTVYTSDFERLYALTPDGGLLWVLDGAGGDWPIDFGDDGTIYAAEALVAGRPQGIVAIDPDGTERWRFTPDDGFDILAGPGVGPDGNIYATQASTFGGLGTFALDPDGTLLWNTPGPTSTTGSNYKILFSPDRFYVAYREDASGGPPIRAYDYAGNELWRSNDLQIAVGSLPELDPTGRLILTWAQIGTQALDPDGGVEWIYDPPGTLGNVVAPTVDSAGFAYSGTVLGNDLFSVDPDGATRWLIEDGIRGFLGQLAVTPDDRVLIDGGAPALGRPSFLRGFDTADGTELWVQDFHVENGADEFTAYLEPGFTPDSGTAYVTTEFAGGNQPGYLYAIDVTAAPACETDCLRSTRIDLRGRALGGSARALARVRVQDEAGSPVAGATVDVLWELPEGDSAIQSAMTDASGFARFDARDGRGTYTVNVTGIAKSGSTFDPDNSVLTKSVSL